MPGRCRDGKRDIATDARREVSRHSFLLFFRRSDKYLSLSLAVLGFRAGFSAFCAVAWALCFDVSFAFFTGADACFGIVFFGFGVFSRPLSALVLFCQSVLDNLLCLEPVLPVLSVLPSIPFIKLVSNFRYFFVQIHEPSEKALIPA